ncbi:MAG TPA: MFS transporter [Rhizomicrobium sp.]|nr:MFS transporter [Rhizomicrobium sp.]
MGRHLYPVAAILLATLVFLTGNGLLGTVTPVRAHLDGFSDLAIGIMGSAYYAGFFIGCFAGPRLLLRVGHSRTFAVAAGLAAATAIAQPLIVNELFWTMVRATIGFAAANLYMVIESWLNDRATNETRGRIFSSYLTVNYTGLIIGQALLIAGGAQSFSLFNLSAMFYALCLIPMGLTRLPQPRPTPVPSLRPLRLFKVAPVGVMGCICVGLANGAVWTLAPVYAQAHDLNKGLIAAFMCALALGGALVQMPLGRLSDRMDRRIVIVGTSLCACAAGVALGMFGGSSLTLTLVLVTVFGMTALPVYGLAVAHTNDRLPRESFVEASATLLLVNSLASVAGPILAALATARAGTGALFYYTAAIHAFLVLFTLYRIRKADPAADLYRDAFRPMPQQASPSALDLDPRGPESVDETP